MMDMQWKLPADLLATSVAIMRPNGAKGHEGLALWFGNTDGRLTEISHVIEVQGPGFRAGALQLRLSLRAFDTLTLLADRIQAHLVGQIHSHPRQMLDLSVTDTVHGIRRQDYLSLVCPHYAQRHVGSVLECGVHVFDRAAYKRLSPQEVTRRISISNQNVVKLTCEVPA